MGEGRNSENKTSFIRLLLVWSLTPASLGLCRCGSSICYVFVVFSVENLQKGMFLDIRYYFPIISKLNSTIFDTSEPMI